MARPHGRAGRLLHACNKMTCASLLRAGESEAAELANFTPSFLWLLRDFYLTLEEDNRTVRPARCALPLCAPPIPYCPHVCCTGS
jgi:hypothetical protein